jgi:hypothetical protein
MLCMYVCVCVFTHVNTNVYVKYAHHIMKARPLQMSQLKKTWTKEFEERAELARRRAA